MIKACWKCRKDFDTQKVNASETVGLCQRCFDDFDQPEPVAATEPIAPKVFYLNEAHELPRVAAPPAPPLNVDYGMPTPLQPLTDEDAAQAAMKALDALPESDREFLAKKLFDILKIPEELRPPRPKTNFGTVGPLERLAQEMNALVQKLKDACIDTNDLDGMKKQLRVASVQSIRSMTPANIPTGFIESVVDQAIEEAFADTPSTPPVTIQTVP